MALRLYRVTTSSRTRKASVAALSPETGKITQASPSLEKYIGLTEVSFLDLCRKNAWTVEEVK